MQNKPSVFKAIVTSLLAFIVFTVVYMVAYLIVGGVFYLLLKIPLIGRLVELLFYSRGDTPDMMLSLLCPGLAYLVTMAIQEALNKETPTKGLSCVILGVLIMLLHIISGVINLIYGEAILKNVVQLVTGFAIFSSGIGHIKKT